MPSPCDNRDAAKSQRYNEREAVHDASDLWAWMNTWGDLNETHGGHAENGAEWVKGYEQAIRDLMKRLREMGVTNCSDHSWRRFTGRAS